MGYLYMTLLQISEKCIAINDESQGSIAKNERCNALLYYTFITHSAGDRVFKIGGHLAKLRAKSLTMSCTPCFVCVLYLHCLCSK